MRGNGSGMPQPFPPRGRRERAKHEKMVHIFDAATELFLANGYAATTTQQIAERADVAEGTLFRYAATKAELLIMVVNAQFRAAVDEGIASIASIPVAREDALCETQVEITTDRVARLLDPTVAQSMGNGDNTLIYQQHVLFGDAGDHHREAMEASEALIAAIAVVVAGGDRGGDRGGDIDASAKACARMIFATMVVAFATAIPEHLTAAEVAGELHDAIRLAVRGYLTPRAAVGSVVDDAPTTPVRDEKRKYK